jgi:hypothetical protein
MSIMSKNEIYYHNKFTNFMNDNDYQDDTTEKIRLYSLDTGGLLHLNLVSGILKLSSKSFKTIPSSKGGYIMKVFNPIFNTLPPFMVKTNRIKDYIDKYVVVKVSRSLDKLTGTYSLIGTIDRYIGDVGNIIAEKNLCQIISTCHWCRRIDKMIKSVSLSSLSLTYPNINMNLNIFAESNMKIVPLIWKDIGVSVCDLTPDRRNMCNRINMYTVSVDPDGCEDIDDAISIEIFSQTGEPIDSVEIGVHISDPSSYLIEGSDLDREISNRTESVYLNDITHHMFPQELSTNLFSLKQNKTNRAFSVMIKMKHIDGIWHDTNHCITKTTININNNTSYDRFQSIIDNDKIQNIQSCEDVKHMRMIYDIGHNLYTQYLDPKKTTTYSSKKMIELFMVLANCKVAEEMVRLSELRESIFPIIIRSQKASTYILNNMDFDNNENQYNNNMMDLLLSEHIKLHTTTAELRYYNRESYHSNRHSSLNLDMYTHFTSPIRRYSDILVHRIMYNLINKNTFKLDCLFDKLNTIGINVMFRMNHYKKFYKHVSHLEKEIQFVRHIIDTIGYCPTDRIIYLCGIVLDISVSNSKSFKTLTDEIITLRVKCIGISDCDPDMSKLNITLHNSGYLNNSIHTIKITNDIEEYMSIKNKITFFQKIDYKMCFLTHDMRKIRTYL